MGRPHSNAPALRREMPHDVRSSTFGAKRGLLRSILARYGVAPGGDGGARALQGLDYEMVLVCDDTTRADEAASVQPSALSPWEEVTDTVMAVAEVACCLGPVNVWFRKGRPVFDMCTFADSRLHDALRPEPADLSSQGDASSLAAVMQAAVSEKAACKRPVLISLVTYDPPLAEVKHLRAVVRRVWAAGSSNFQFQVIVCGGTLRAYRKFERGTRGFLSVIGGFEAERRVSTEARRPPPSRGQYILTVLTAPMLNPILPEPVSEPDTAPVCLTATRGPGEDSNVPGRREECCLVM
ncbi:hypothetical protein DIPPA_27875 [Diplonema papillatum]|nr:hypothetical protein DIPPA_27875 [Diplonema papillatum]